MDLFSPLGILPVPWQEGQVMPSLPVNSTYGNCDTSCLSSSVWDSVLSVRFSWSSFCFGKENRDFPMVGPAYTETNHGGNLVHYSASHKRSYISRSLCCGELEQISSKWQYATAGCKIWIMLISHYVDLINIFWLSTTKQYIWSILQSGKPA